MDPGTDERAVLRRIGEAPEEFQGHTYWNCKIVRFDGRDYVVSDRAILTLVTSAACNAACKFCSNEVTFTPSGPYLSYDDSLERVKQFCLLSDISKVAFTGGEPTLNPQKLYELARKVIPGFKKARLHTNGWGLLHGVQTEVGPRRLLDALIDEGLSGASLSVAHHDPDLNAVVMRHKGSWKGLTDSDLRAIVQHATGTFTPRLSCVLTNEGVNSVDDILGYIDWGVGLGYRRFIFRSCSWIPDEYRKASDFAIYNSSNYIPIDPLTEALGRRNDFVQTYAQHKSDSHVHVYKIGDITVDIDESSEEPDPDPKIRRVNVMPDGVVYTSWIDPLSVLFEEDKERGRRAAIEEGVRAFIEADSLRLGPPISATG